jgi:DNA-directed RNA polymerase subunit H (RpoH/RPB5)
LSSDITIEEKKANSLMSSRGYKILKREEKKEGVAFLAKMPRYKTNVLIWCIPTEGTVGVQYINQMKKAMKEEEVERGIIISSGRYTQTAKSNATKKHIELLSKIPSFDLFDHILVPKHEIMKPEEKQKLLDEYRVKPYQLPRIQVSDPAARAIGARPGDIVRIIRDSPTAGKYIAYRYVVEG